MSKSSAQLKTKSNFWDWFNNEVRPKLKFTEDGGLAPLQRGDTFAQTFEYLDSLKRPIRILETGCARFNSLNDATYQWYGDGKSTLIFDRYVNENGGIVYSVDINPTYTENCRQLVSKKTKIHTGDSVEYLKKLAAKPPADLKQLDLLYLDSFDCDLRSGPLASQVHHMNELYAIMPLIGPETLVVVDDSPPSLMDHSIVEIVGKGKLVAQYAMEVGAIVKFSGWQTGWIGLHKPQELRTVADLDELLKDTIERARKHFNGGEYVQASMLYQKVLMNTIELLTGQLTTGVMRIARGEACVSFARICYANERLGAALDWYKRALAADPLAVDYRLELASKVFRRMRFWEAGRKEAEVVTRIDPQNIHAWGILGSFEHDMNNVQNTIYCYDKELEIDPNDSGALLDRISIALDTADHKFASELSQKLLKTDRRADALHCLALVAYREARHEEAIELYDQALAGDKLTHKSTVHWNRSLALHSIGRYKEGWAEHSHRKDDVTQAALSIPVLRFNRPMWNGEPPPLTIHVHMEAGAGDNICCTRYLTVLKEQGYDVRYESYPDMEKLISRSFPDIPVLRQAADYPGGLGIRNFDYHIPIGELPHIMGTEVDTVPNKVPYIKPDMEMVEKYGKLLPNDGRKKVGICWSSGIRLDTPWIIEYGHRKSTNFKTISPLLKVPGYYFTSLQVGPERAENDGSLSDLLPQKPDWDDTAALIANLDLVITVDTAVMHLAGAMAKTTWVMAQRDGASWHLLCWRPDASWNEASPWYPTARLFRQHRFNEPHFWDEVVEDIAKELSKEGVL